MTIEEIKKDKEINALIEKADHVLGTLGFTEHSKAHASKVSKEAGLILRKLGYRDEDIKLAEIAGFMHDIGNAINRNDHAHTGALLAYTLLKERGLTLEERITIMSAIGNHDEKTGSAIDAISASLILADKSDVRRNRVRTKNIAQFDAHDKVNYSVLESKIEIDEEKKKITLRLTLDEEISSVMDYFEIFMERMIMCRKASIVLGLTFSLNVNGTKLC